MRKNIFVTLSLAAVFVLALPSFAQVSNKLTKQEQKDGWALLFNGKNFDGWRQCNGTAMPANWKIDDDAMQVFTGEGRNRDKAQTEIFYTRVRNIKTLSFQ